MKPDEFMEFFLEFENTYQMFSKKVKDIYIWHYIRFNVFHKILNIYGLGDFLPDVRIKRCYSKWKWENFINRFLICNQFFAHNKSVLIIPHERKFYDGNGKYKCIYTDLLDKYMTNSHYILDKRSMEGEFAVQNSHNILYCDLESFKRVKKINDVNEFADKKELNNIIFDPIEKYFNIKIDWKVRKKLAEVINYCINARKYWTKYYNYMLCKIKPKIILMVVSYTFDRMILCEEAKKKNIPVVELQHGTIGPMHIAYNFYEKMELPSFPDYFFAFGKFEKDKAKFPIDRDKIIPVGYPELEKNCKIYKRQKNLKKIILFVSQQEEKIAEYAEILAQNLDSEKYHIIFQLHPKEYFDWKKKLGDHLNYPNVEIVGSYEHTVHESLAQADWVIGNFSTVLYEAQMYKTKVAVLRFGLYSNMKYLYESGQAILIDSPKQLVKEIKENTFKPNRKISVFETNSLEKMQVNINKIIKGDQKSIGKY